MEVLYQLSYSGLFLSFGTGAGDEARTRDIQLGRLMLYQLSYTRLKVVGRAGFEPAKSIDNRFTVCPQLAALVSPRNQNVKDELVIRFELTTG